MALIDDAILQQINFARYSDGLVSQIRALLLEADIDLGQKLAKAKEDTWTKKYLESKIKITEELINKSTSDIEKFTREELSKFSKVASAATLKTMKSSFGSDFIAPSAEQLIATVTSNPFEGAYLKEWFSSLNESKKMIVLRTLRLASAEGETIDETVTKLIGTKKAGYKDGLLEMKRRDAEAIVRTATNHTNNQAAQLTYAANSDVISGWQFVATLDSRTTPQCAVLDKRVYPVGEGPIPPRHFRCRSFSLPMTKSFKSLGIDAEEVTGGTRASETGPVPADLTYSKWLKSAPEEIQNKVLGIERANLFRAGDLALDKFVSDGRVLTLEQLAEEYPWADIDVREGSIPSSDGMFRQISSAEEKKALDIEKRLSLYRSSLKRHLIDDTPLPSRLSTLLDDISPAEREKILSEVEKAKLKIKGRPTVALEELNIKDFDKIESQKGSNPGGLYRHKVTGEQWYMKFNNDPTNTRNELLANRLYRMAGIEVPETTVVKNGSSIGIASKWQTGLTKLSPAKLSTLKGAKDGYVVDAWLANWDVVGSSYDNLLVTSNGTAIRIDAGGSLLYRAKNGLKGSRFGDDVGELISFLDDRLNLQSYEVFKNITSKELVESAKKVLAISDDDIRNTVLQHGPYVDKVSNVKLGEQLIKRKKFIADKYPEAVPGWVAPRRVLISDPSLEFAYSDLLTTTSTERKALLLSRLEEVPDTKDLTVSKIKHVSGVYTIEYADAKKNIVGYIEASLYKDESVIYSFTAHYNNSAPTLRPELMDNWFNRYGSGATPQEISKLKSIMKNARPWMRIKTDDKVVHSGLDAILSEKGYKGQVQIFRESRVKVGGGMVNPAARQAFEIGVFNIAEKGSDLSRFPKYGYWSDAETGMVKGNYGPNQYGSIRIKFKNELRNRATATINDSLDSDVTKTAILTKRATTSNLPFHPDNPHKALDLSGIHDKHTTYDLASQYVEAQYYGTVNYRDIEAVYVDGNTYQKITNQQLRRLQELNIPIYIDK